MAMATAISAVVVAAVGGQTARVGGGRERPDNRSERRDQRRREDRRDERDLEPQEDPTEDAPAVSPSPHKHCRRPQ